MPRRLAISAGLLLVAVILSLTVLTAWVRGSSKPLPESTTTGLAWEEVGRLTFDSVGPGVWAGDRFLLITWLEGNRRLMASPDGAQWIEVGIPDEFDEVDLSLWSDGTPTVLLWSRSAVLRSDDSGETFTPVKGLDLEVPSADNRGIGIIIQQAMVRGDTTFLITTTHIEYPTFLSTIDLPGLDPDNIHSSGFSPTGFHVCVGEQDSRECSETQIDYAELRLEPDQITALRASNGSTIWASTGGAFRPISVEPQVGHPIGPMFESQDFVAVSTGQFLLHGDGSHEWARSPLPSWASAHASPTGQIVATTPNGDLLHSTDGSDWIEAVETAANLQTTSGPGGLITVGSPDSYEFAGFSSDRRAIIGWSPNGADWAWQFARDLPVDQSVRREIDERYNPVVFVVGDENILAVPNSFDRTEVPVLRAVIPTATD